jgi:hypothetical protein
MSADKPILERWIAETIRTYPSATVPFLSSQNDPFRNPVGHTLRQSLAILFEQLQGDMDADRIASALDAVVRIRAVQDLIASQAVAFVFLLKPILRELASEHDQMLLANRVDQLALMAFDKYMQCREQLVEIRLSERLRRIPARRAVG